MTVNGQQYAYDVNGNMTKDLSRSIQSVEYNMLNLPRQITFSDGSSITNMYDADGRKLRTTRNIVIGGTTTSNVTDYCGDLILEQGIPSRILTGYGYASITSLSSNQWTPTAASYSYYIKDHLGSVRIVANSSGSVLQKNTYYAFGGLMADQCTGADVQPYKFQGKELDRTHGLEWNDHGARFADLLVSRWMTIDPLCEKYYSMSPYLLCGGNMVNKIDTNGKEWYQTASGNIYWNPKVHSQSDLQKGYTYIGSTYIDAIQNANYRKDGTIIYQSEKDGYNRMMLQADHSTTESNKRGKEQMAFILADGRTIVMPDNWNDSETSIMAPGYSRANHLLTDSNGNGSQYVAQIHTHPKGSDKGISMEDALFAKCDPGIMIYIMHGDGNVYGGFYSKSRNGYDDLNNKPLLKVQDLLSGKIKLRNLVSSEMTK